MSVDEHTHTHTYTSRSLLHSLISSYCAVFHKCTYFKYELDFVMWSQAVSKSQSYWNKTTWTNQLMTKAKWTTHLYKYTNATVSWLTTLCVVNVEDILIVEILKCLWNPSWGPYLLYMVAIKTDFKNVRCCLDVSL